MNLYFMFFTVEIESHFYFNSLVWWRPLLPATGIEPFARLAHLAQDNCTVRGLATQSQFIVEKEENVVC